MKLKWKIIYDEEVFDHWGENIAGVILCNDGGDVLFFHTHPHEENGPLYTHIYNSIWMDDDSEECCFLDTDENMDILFNALNNAENICDITGDDGLLHQIEFKNGTEA